MNGNPTLIRVYCCIDSDLVLLLIPSTIRMEELKGTGLLSHIRTLNPSPCSEMRTMKSSGGFWIVRLIRIIITTVVTPN